VLWDLANMPDNLKAARDRVSKGLLASDLYYKPPQSPGLAATRVALVTSGIRSPYPIELAQRNYIQLNGSRAFSHAVMAMLMKTLSWVSFPSPPNAIYYAHESTALVQVSTKWHGFSASSIPAVEKRTMRSSIGRWVDLGIAIPGVQIFQEFDLIWQARPKANGECSDNDTGLCAEGSYWLNSIRCLKGHEIFHVLAET
jgi:hypothetical protein